MLFYLAFFQHIANESQQAGTFKQIEQNENFSSLLAAIVWDQRLKPWTLVGKKRF